MCVNGGIGDIQGLVDIKNVVRPTRVRDSETVMELLWSDISENGPLPEGYRAKKLGD